MTTLIVIGDFSAQQISSIDMSRSPTLANFYKSKILRKPHFHHPFRWFFVLNSQSARKTRISIFFILQYLLLPDLKIRFP